MNDRDSVPYTHCDDNIVEHARWVLSLMGPDASDILDNRYHRDDSDDGDDGNNSDDSDDGGVRHLFGRLPEKWWMMNLKYVRQKSGGGCGSGKRFVPVSCSKNCPKCHGCSPGCGRNYEFEKIDGFSLNTKTWDHLLDQFNKHRHVKYIMLELDSSV